MKEERYQVTVTFNVYACTGQDAKIKAKDAADYLAKTYTGSAVVEKIEKAPFGDLKTYPI